MSLSVIFEEAFPFVYYICRCRRLRRRAETGGILVHGDFAKHEELSPDELRKRLAEEHTRARAMDEKTFKLTLSFSLGLTIVGLATSSLVGTLSCVALKVTITLVLGLGTLFVLAAAFLALGALRTLPFYGYGTAFLLRARHAENGHTALAEALARQETMNTVRHLRNEAAYQALRNGLVLVLCGFCLFMFALVSQYIRTIQTS